MPLWKLVYEEKKENSCLFLVCVPNASYFTSESAPVGQKVTAAKKVFTAAHSFTSFIRTNSLTYTFQTNEVQAFGLDTN